jgi:hypothetical protein
MEIFRRKRVDRVQAKCRQNSVGNDAVQQVFTGMTHYGCHRCVAVTTSYFTSSGKTLAESVRCTLVEGSQFPVIVRPAQHWSQPLECSLFVSNRRARRYPLGVVASVAGTEVDCNEAPDVPTRGGLHLGRSGGFRWVSVGLNWLLVAFRGFRWLCLSGLSRCGSRVYAVLTVKTVREKMRRRRREICETNPNSRTELQLVLD